ncbi:substrate-binding periplasmic protein [Nonomuraea diastatica]|uniref:Transporter substrate-binding domain-containing protein n=1 Tax=Nonomuraea diastatica TaxID=1848329 RepID=A0A4R4WVJ7_9ACTN|nr:transporter substrate-binding domain-containing protein [Nonomuraea diastatica]TDD21704.1 transporter substrate-binding domain-containing protein [Nonomuraea diastatica]
MKSGKRSRSAGALAAALLLVTACGSSSAKLPSPLDLDIVTVGVKEYPGLFQNEGPDPVGFEESARNKIMENAGVKQSTPTWTRTNNWQSQLADNKVHMVMGMISDTDTRADDFRLARSYLRTDIGLLTLANAKQVRNVKELAGETICTVERTSADETIKMIKQAVPLVPTTALTPEACIEKVKQGEAFAYSTDRIILMGYTIDDNNVIRGKSVLQVLDLPLGREQHISIALRKEHEEACRQLVKAIDTYVKSNHWLADLRAHLINEYERLAPGNPRMTDKQIRDKFQPSVIDAERCTDQD